MDNKNFYAVLMAGGVGSRFWPVSTQKYPKQFHDMLGTGETLIQKTFSRLTRFIPAENIFVLTNTRYKELCLEQLPKLNSTQVVLEPVMRNTAPCILYAALKIYKLNPKAQMIVAPCDHWIENEKEFEDNIIKCFHKTTEKGALGTLGIRPTFPNTGFGYIEYNKEHLQNEFYPVVKFREKPNYETAKSFLEQGNFLWNAGIFIWSAATIIEAFKEHQKDLYVLFADGLEVFNTADEEAFIHENYHKADNISIDYAILEKAASIYVIPASFDWNDLGTWGSLYSKMEKDAQANAVVSGKILSEDSSGNMIRLPKNKVAVIDGLKDYIIIDKDEVLMIYPKSKEQDIKTILAKVKTTFGENYT